MPKKTSKVRDKWRDKAWLVVEASPAFGSTPVAYVPVTEVEAAAGRVVETTLYDLLKQDPQHYSVKIYFQVTGVHDGRAATVFKGHEYSREFLRSLVRRGSSMVSLVKDYTARDGVRARVYAVLFAQHRINASRKHALRLIADRIVTEKAAALTYDQFAQEAVLGKIASDIYNEAKKITHLRHVGIRKTKLVQAGPAGVPPAPPPTAEAPEAPSPEVPEAVAPPAAAA